VPPSAEVFSTCVSGHSGEWRKGDAARRVVCTTGVDLVLERPLDEAHVLHVVTKDDQERVTHRLVVVAR
jgi:streptomycin 6-kinase